MACLHDGYHRSGTYCQSRAAVVWADTAAGVRMPREAACRGQVSRKELVKFLVAYTLHTGGL